MDPAAERTRCLRALFAVCAGWTAGLFLAAAAPAASAGGVVSLAPSLTEIAYAIGCGPQLVADTTYDDYPAAARRLPHVADLVQVDLERIAVLEPRIVLALHDQEREGAPLQTRLGLHVVYLPNRGLPDLFKDITAVGSACDRRDGAAKLAASLQRRLTRLHAQTQRYHSRPKVFVLLDLPGFTAGKNSFLDDLVRLAGGVNVTGGINQPYPNVSAEWLLDTQPDVIIVSRATPFGAAVRATQPWRGLRAVQRGRVFSPPSDDIVQRNGPRIVDGLAWLAGIIRR